MLVAAIVILAFTAGMLAVFGGHEWALARMGRYREGYISLHRPLLRRLFYGLAPQRLFFLNLLGALVLGPSLGVLMESPTLGLLTTIGCYVAPRLVLKILWHRRIGQVNDQVEDACSYMANSLKASPSLEEAFEFVVHHVPVPISQEFALMLQEYRLGNSMEEVLVSFDERIPTRNVFLAVMALIIGKNVGGNLPRILEEISATIREAKRLEGLIDSKTAEGKLQAWVMGLVPVFLLAAIWQMNPEMVEPLFNDRLGWLILGLAVLLDIAGVYLIIKICKIDA